MGVSQLCRNDQLETTKIVREGTNSQGHKNLNPFPTLAFMLSCANKKMQRKSATPQN
jgi:hypothetical protein